MDGKELTPQSLCAKGGERCDLHFLVENEVIQTKDRVNRLETHTNESLDVLNKMMNDLIVEMRTFVGSQDFRDKSHQEMKALTLANTSDINELKSSIRSLEQEIRISSASNDKTYKLLETLTEDIKALDKTVMSKEDIIEIVSAAIVADKNTDKEKWFESLPAKISAGIAILSFITFFTIKIVVLLLTI